MQQTEGSMVLTATTWQRIAEFWRALSRTPQHSFGAALRQVAAALRTLLDGSHISIVIQQRTEPESVGLDGFHPVFTRMFGPEAEKRLEITREWAAHEPRLVDDPILRRITSQAGAYRVVGHRGEVAPDKWERAPVRRLLELLSLEDRIGACVPLRRDVEVTFCVDRPVGEPIFDETDHQVFDAVVEGLRRPAAQFVRCHGYLPGQRSLERDEQELMERLLSPAPEAEIGAAMGLEPAEFEALAERVFDKLDVADRLGLTHLWLYADAPDGAHADAPASTERYAAAASPLEAGPLVPRAHQAIERVLSAQAFDVEAVAGELGMSVRALQRQLREADTSFRELVERVRRSRAEVLLSRPWLTFTDIALQLGYSQVSSFNRAVKRWTGQTPSELRERMLDAD